jgi:hypothetical protein
VVALGIEMAGVVPPDDTTGAVPVTAVTVPPEPVALIVIDPAPLLIDTPEPAVNVVLVSVFPVVLPIKI